MPQNEDLTLSELGLPRANANGLFLLGLALLTVFGLIAYSCSRDTKSNNNAFQGEPQPLSGNEWFIGQAKGIELPQPPPEPPASPKPKQPTRTTRIKAQPPQKKLGGKIFGQTSNREPEAQRLVINSPPPFDPGSQLVRASADRPGYYLERNVEPRFSDFEVKAGSIIPAQLDMGINSDLGGPAVAHVTRTIYDTVTGQFSLIPPGTKLYGRVDPNITFGQSRVDVVWERLIFPNGASLVVQNMRASDRSGQAGLHHTVDNHFDNLFGGTILLSAISAGAQLSQPQQSANFGGVPSAGQTLAAALGQNLSQVSSEFIRRQMNVKPTVIIPSAEHFTIIVNKDMVLPGPYGTWD